MKSNKGILSQYGLWDFWNSLPQKTKDSIMKYFEETPLTFDYTHLFDGDWKHINPRTPVTIIDTLFVCDDLNTCDLFFYEVTKNQSIHKSNENYWLDTHFFLTNYTKKVYKHFYNNNCSNERFLNGCKFEFDNINLICDALKSKNFFPVKNAIIEQFLIYLEKNKKFESVVEYSSHFKSMGWTNDFDKRIIRCNKKINDYGNKG